MTRDMFTRVVASTLRRSPSNTPEQLAELIALKMEELAELLGEASPASTPPPAATTPLRGSWPAVNPQSAQEVVEAEPQTLQDIPVGEPLVRLASRIPDRQEAPPAATPAPTPPKKPAQKLKVEQLNQLIQDSTPIELSVEILNPEGPPIQILLKREVQSQHAAECVKLLYQHPKHEDWFVQAVLSIEDESFDMNPILQKLKRDASQLMRVRTGPVVSVAPPPPRGAIVSGLDNSSPTAEELQQIESSFRSIPNS